MKDQALTQKYVEDFGFRVPKVQPVSLGALFRKFNDRRRMVQTRRQLSNLDERLLTDVGLTPEQAKAESSLPFWKGELVTFQEGDHE
ncbi:MAG: DUF1127 domain-containing protein [Gammaproteobacteria bacterium]|jgi:uncharacterized protein YjiS (DUF1127 family)